MHQPENIDYLVIVQCDIVMQRCSGYFCEKAFAERTGGFSEYPRGKSYRTLHLTCGGCCGLAVHRKLDHVTRRIAKFEEVAKERIAVRLASCITKDNYHGPPCPHLDYLKTLIAKLGLEVLEDTHISQTAEKRRAEGLYTDRPQG